MMSSITSIDTNVLLLLWAQDPAWNQRASAAIQAASKRGKLCICGPVFSELVGLPGRDAGQLQSLIEASGIDIEWDLNETVWQAAGLAYQGYVQRRRTSGGGLPRRMLTDLLIGAHASVREYRLLSMDQDIYRAAFPLLHIESV
jgi:predicted nucleic acid-binding protein